MPIQAFTENGRVPVTVVQVQGSIDASTSEMFQARTNELIRNGARHMLVDLTHSPFVSKAGLRALHRLFDALRAIHPDVNLSDEEVKDGIRLGTYKSPDLKLLNVSRATRRLLEGTGFDMYIETFSDMKKAIASF